MVAYGKCQCGLTTNSETIATFRNILIAFPHKMLAVPCSNDNFYPSLFMITPNDFVCGVYELEFSRI